MAENTSATVSILSNPAIAAPNSLIAINATAQLPLKLSPTNYLTWRAQFNALLIGYDLMQYVDGTYPEPPTTINNTVNPTHTLWHRQDQLLLHSIIASVSEKIMPLIASSTTSHMAWEKIKTLYANRSRSRVMSLKERLTATTKGSNSVREFLNTMRSISDELSIIGEPPSDIDLVVHVLNGLGPPFNSRNQLCA
uniref:Retrotransposon Copia-like N-terminal domain-containing protein n=1 Tax=Salix viminalis TaxID=40686 RepID=A0A6N2LJF4_SALVM